MTLGDMQQHLPEYLRPAKRGDYGKSHCTLWGRSYPAVGVYWLMKKKK